MSSFGLFNVVEDQPVYFCAYYKSVTAFHYNTVEIIVMKIKPGEKMLHFSPSVGLG